MTLYSLFLSSLGLNLHGIVHVKLSLMTMLVICVASWVILFYNTVPYYVTMLNAVILIIYLTLIDMQKSTSCLSLASCTIPLTSGKQSGRIPGWSEYVAPYKDKNSSGDEIANVLVNDDIAHT